MKALIWTGPARNGLFLVAYEHERPGDEKPPSHSTQPFTYESLDIWHAVDYCGYTDKDIHTDGPNGTKEAALFILACMEHSVYMHCIMDLVRPLAYRNQRAYACLT